MSKRYEKIGPHTVYLDETYYIAYAGGKRELPAKDQKEYNKIINLPPVLQRKELKNIPFEKNPNVVPIKGSMLMSFVRELNFVPFFDQFFSKSHLIKLTDRIVFESMKTKSYDAALRGV